MVIWRITDGRHGHDNQSRGLVNALRRLENCSSYDIDADRLKFPVFNCLVKRFPPGAQLPRPDLIIGAGHGTHLPVLCARRASRGRTVIIMRPSLPARCFDFCLVPDHDAVHPRGNIIITHGAINTVLPSADHMAGQGLILIGGPSRHHDWNEQQVLEQIRTILVHDHDISWRISDAPRTPAATSRVLQVLGCTNAAYHYWQNTGHDWVEKQLARAGRVWVTADSVSMIYEALTSGAMTGILSVPEKTPGKLTRVINKLTNEGMVTPFPEWQNGRALSSPPRVLDEATRCARLLLQQNER